MFSGGTFLKLETGSFKRSINFTLTYVRLTLTCREDTLVSLSRGVFVIVTSISSIIKPVEKVPIVHFVYKSI